MLFITERQQQYILNFSLDSLNIIKKKPMKPKKKLDLLNKASDLKFLTRKRNIVNDQSNANYDLGNEISYNTKVLKSNLCHNNHTYILVRSDIACIKHNVAA